MKFWFQNKNLNDAKIIIKIWVYLGIQYKLPTIFKFKDNQSYLIDYVDFRWTLIKKYLRILLGNLTTFKGKKSTIKTKEFILNIFH